MQCVARSAYKHIYFDEKEKKKKQTLDRTSFDRTIFTRILNTLAKSRTNSYALYNYNTVEPFIPFHLRAIEF